METATVTLADFLLARIAEDEATARASLTERPWRYEGYGDYGPFVSGASAGTDDSAQGQQIARFIAHNSPARVLAECEAKRRILRDHGDRHICEDGMQGEWTDEEGDTYPPCDVLRAISLPYADHPDCRNEWRP